MSASIDIDGKTNGEMPYAVQARQTVVLEKIGDLWLVAHEHISVPFIPRDVAASGTDASQAGVKSPDNATEQGRSEAVAEVCALTNAYFNAWTFGEEGIVWETFRSLFMLGEDGITVIDTYAGAVTVITSFEDYVSTWSPVVDQAWANLSTTSEDGISVKAEGDPAVGMFILRAEGTMRDGEPASCGSTRP